MAIEVTEEPILDTVSAGDRVILLRGLSAYQFDASGLITLPVTPDAFGAVGDGAAIDSDAIDAALAAAGPWGEIVFTSGKTYLVDKTFTLQEGQRVNLNGATIKRAPQAITTLTASFNDAGSGSVTLTVADTNDFRVGTGITICNTAKVGTDNPWKTDPERHTLLAKTETTLTVEGNFFGSSADTDNYASGAEVITAYWMWYVPAEAPYCRIYGGTIDGSTTAHDFGAETSTANGYQIRGRRWWTLNEVFCLGDHAVISDLVIRDAPGEGIVIGGEGSVVERCVGINIGGNFTHNTQGNDLSLSKLHVVGANRVWIEYDAGNISILANNMTTGHENGAFAWSQGCERVRLSDCYAEDAKAVFAPLNTSGNDKATILNVTGRNCVAAFYMDTYDSQGEGVTISTCRFYDCGVASIVRNEADAPPADSQVRTILRDCRFHNTRIALTNVHQVMILGGFIRYDDPSDIADAHAIRIDGGSDITISTEIDGAIRGIFALGTIEGLTIESAKIRRVKTYAVHLASVSLASKRIRFCRNQIDIRHAIDRPGQSDLAVDEGMNAIALCANALAEGNDIRMERGLCAFSLPDTATQVRIRANNIETNPDTGTATPVCYPVLLPDGSESVFVDNWITVNPLVGTPADHTIADNRTIAWA